MEAKKLYFMECHLAGRQYHDADDVFCELRVGTPLRLVRDRRNRYDPDAIAVVYDKPLPQGKSEAYKIGYVPAADNHDLAQLMDMGWGCAFCCNVSMVNPEAHYENQIRMTIKIVRNENQTKKHKHEHLYSDMATGNIVVHFKKV